METLLTTKEASRMLQFPISTFSWWIRQGVVMPTVPGSGPGSKRKFSIQQVWAIGIAKSIKAGGQSVDFACAVARMLESFAHDAIMKAFNEGRTCLMVFNVDGRLEILPYLVSPDAITDNPILIKQREEAKRQGLMLQWHGIDTKPMYDQILDHAQQKQAAERN